MMSKVRVLIMLLALPCFLGTVSPCARAESSASLTALVYKKIVESQQALREKKLEASQSILESIAEGSRWRGGSS